MRDDIILLGHGSGGQMTHDLVSGIILPAIHENGVYPEQEDSVALTLPGGNIRFTTDSYVVDPIIFPGGDIGDLAVNGTINDLAMGGAIPFVISLGFIIEEGLSIREFKTILRSIGRASREAGVPIVCGDTKVVPRGRGDKLFINTSGVGVARGGNGIGGKNIRPGDALIINGTVGDHGVAVMSARNGLEFESPVKSDTAALHTLTAALFDGGIEIHAMRDPTRGGLATVAVELAEAAGVTIRLDERAIPIDPAVAGACEILGLDPLLVANEGKMIVVTPRDNAEKALDIMRKHPLGAKAAIIGEVTDGKGPKVTSSSFVGGTRIVRKLPGELLPRIC